MRQFQTDENFLTRLRAIAPFVCIWGSFIVAVYGYNFSHPLMVAGFFSLGASMCWQTVRLFVMEFRNYEPGVRGTVRFISETYGNMLFALAALVALVGSVAEAVSAGAVVALAKRHATGEVLALAFGALLLTFSLKNFADIWLSWSERRSAFRLMANIVIFAKSVLAFIIGMTLLIFSAVYFSRGL